MVFELPDLKGWTFDVEEVSANVYKFVGRDQNGRTVEGTGVEVDAAALVQTCSIRDRCYSGRSPTTVALSIPSTSVSDLSLLRLRACRNASPPTAEGSVPAKVPDARLIVACSGDGKRALLVRALWPFLTRPDPEQQLLLPRNSSVSGADASVFTG